MDFLPHVDNCCIVVPIFLGSILIAIYCIVLGGANALFWEDEDLGKASCILAIIFIIVSILCLIGILLSVRFLVALWVWSAVFIALLAIILFIVALARADNEKAHSKHDSARTGTGDATTGSTAAGTTATPSSAAMLRDDETPAPASTDAGGDGTSSTAGGSTSASGGTSTEGGTTKSPTHKKSSRFRWEYVLFIVLYLLVFYFVIVVNSQWEHITF